MNEYQKKSSDFKHSLKRWFNCVMFWNEVILLQTSLLRIYQMIYLLTDPETEAIAHTSHSNCKEEAVLFVMKFWNLHVQYLQIHVYDLIEWFQNWYIRTSDSDGLSIRRKSLFTNICDVMLLLIFFCFLNQRNPLHRFQCFSLFGFAQKSLLKHLRTKFFSIKDKKNWRTPSANPSSNN